MIETSELLTELRPAELSGPVTVAPVAADFGIPAITAESGERGILERDAVERHLRGLRNVLRCLGPLPGDAEVFDRPAEHQGWIWMKTSDAGWWEPAVQPGAAVAEGEILGTVAPLTGGEPTPITASAAGVPIFITSSPAVSAD